MKKIVIIGGGLSGLYIGIKGLNSGGITGTTVKIPGDNRTNWIRISVGPNLDKNRSLLKIFKENNK